MLEQYSYYELVVDFFIFLFFFHSCVKTKRSADLPLLSRDPPSKQKKTNPNPNPNPNPNQSSRTSSMKDHTTKVSKTPSSKSLLSSFNNSRTSTNSRSSSSSDNSDEKVTKLREIKKRGSESDEQRDFAEITRVFSYPQILILIHRN